MKNTILILLVMAALTASSQSAISYGERTIFHELGHPDHTALSSDTIIRTYLDGEEILFFVDEKVVRSLSYLSPREARREQRVINLWNTERNGWRWTGITKCRMIKDASSHIFECRKYDRHNPLPEPLAVPPKQSAVEILAGHPNIGNQWLNDTIKTTPGTILKLMEEYAAQFTQNPAEVVQKEKEISKDFK